MPLDDLVSVVETLKSRLQTHRHVLQANETRTRMALIDPLLQALGWDTADPALVLPEYEVSGQRERPDYALLDGAGKPVALVEAKRLGEPLVSHRMQIVNYANLSGVPYAGLTDGNQWELYKVFDPAPMEDRLLLNLSIADRPAHEVALKLLLLWQPNLAADQPVAASEPVLTTVTEPVTPQPVAEPEIERPTAPPPRQAPEPPPASAGWVPLPELVYAKGGQNPKPPKQVRLPDGSTCEIEEFWWELQASIARWLWAEELLAAGNIPVKYGTSHIVSMDGKQPSGRPFQEEHQIADTPLILNTWTAARESVGRSKRLLQECGINAEDVQLQFGED